MEAGGGIQEMHLQKIQRYASLNDPFQRPPTVSTSWDWNKFDNNDISRARWWPDDDDRAHWLPRHDTKPQVDGS